MQDKIRTLLADDHPLVRLGIRTTLNETNDIEVVGEAKQGREILPLCIRSVPDVLLLDLSMPDLDPTATVAAVRAEMPQMKVLILSAHNTSAHVRNMTEANVDGYVLKDDAPEDVVQAVRAVTRGEVWYSQAVIRQILALKRTEPSITDTKLNERERQIVILIAEGLNNAQIAAKLHLGEQTVRNYVSNIYRALDVSSRIEAALWAIKHDMCNTESGPVLATDT